MLSRSFRAVRVATPLNNSLWRTGASTRAVSTNAATALADKSSIPSDDDKQFTISLSPDSFQTYDVDLPPLEVVVTKGELKDMYRHMGHIRNMERAADRLYKERKIRGFCHLSTGQEAVAVGIEHAITPEDQIITAYRCHGFAYMRGGTITSIIAELLGRRDGIAFGKGGSMHMFTKGFFGGNGIVGAQVPVGAGIGFAMKYLGRPNTTFALYGDGAANQGQVFEAYNMAKLWKLPVIFGCENNQYGMGTSAARASALTEYYKRGQYMPGIKVNGMDVLAVKFAAAFAKEYTIQNGPLIMEFVTYRYGGHSMSDPGTSYRSRDEVLRIKSTNDPVQGLTKKLIDWDILTEDDIAVLDEENKAFVNKQVAEAEQSLPPEDTAEVLYKDIYVPGSEPVWMRGRTVEETYYYPRK